jgi:hypothetical protein
VVVAPAVDEEEVQLCDLLEGEEGHGQRIPGVSGLEASGVEHQEDHQGDEDQVHFQKHGPARDAMTAKQDEHPESGEITHVHPVREVGTAPDVQGL